MTVRTGEVCAIEGCEKPRFGRGWCSMHYARWQAHGDPQHQTRRYVAQPKTCAVEGCGEKPSRRGMCGMHVRRVINHGEPTDPRERRFWAKVDKNGPVPEHRPELGPCWLWSGYVQPATGYGLFGGHGQTRLVHRISYQYVCRPIPKGLHLDHLCRVRRCLRPSHLEPVTPRENIARGNGGDSWGYVPDPLPPKPPSAPKPTTCTEDGCEKPVYKRTICRTHYRRWLRDPSVERPSQRTPGQRFWAKVEKTPTCWFWTAGVNPGTGYGQFSPRHGVQVGAHRFSFELTNGPIPDGFDVHHTCLTRRCVRPDHLQAVSRAENLRLRANRRT